MTCSYTPSFSNPALLRHQLFIDGCWRNAAENARFPVVNPADQSEIAWVADAGSEDIECAIVAAHRAQPGWAAMTANARARLLRQWFDLITFHQEDLAQLLTWEQGKPLAEARAEVAYGASYIEWFSEEAKRIYGDVIAPPDDNKRLLTIKQPVGVVGLITPWNFPSAMLARKMAPALAAGCTLVAKPAAETPLSALALAYLAAQAGIPAGVINILPSTNADAFGKQICAHELIRKISFTGSTAVGKKLITQIAPDLKRITLELGGNAPFIVFDDADLDKAVAGALASKFRNAGQTCVCANRFYIHQSVYAQFCEKLSAAAADLVIGSGFAKDVTIGPLISSAAMDKVKRLVDSALTAGARIIFQRDPEAGAAKAGNFYPVQILADVPPDALITQQEIFGPVVTLIPFTDEALLRDWINATPYGLAGYFYTRNQTRIWRFAEAVETGMIGVNTGLISNAAAPFGGVKQSGWGREGSRYGIEDFIDIKYVCWDITE